MNYEKFENLIELIELKESIDNLIEYELTENYEINENVVKLLNRGYKTTRNFLNTDVTKLGKFFRKKKTPPPLPASYLAGVRKKKTPPPLPKRSNNPLRAMKNDMDNTIGTPSKKSDEHLRKILGL